MNRKEALHNLEREAFDILVIGGGITGAGIALDAASRGLRVALIEMQDFAAGTSSRSTKLIHGGLRYLKQFDFRLVNEVGRERAVLHRLAPHLVHPDKMLLPLVQDGNYGYWLTTIGLSVYDFLAGVEGSDRKQMLTRKETLALEPLLRDEGLEGGGLYAEYRTDDARLVIAVIQSAWKQGACAVNYVKANSFRYENDRIAGVEAEDMRSGDRFGIRAKAVINACGPWVDVIRSMDTEPKGKHLLITKGVHLVCDRSKLPLRHTVYFDHADKRMIFAVPRGHTVYIGTTDTVYAGDPRNPQVDEADLDYLLSAVNAMFPSSQLRREDIESSWAGLRPLIHEEGKSPSEVSRKDELFLSPKGLISIAGGKLTGYRKMAERAVDKALETHDIPADKCRTESLVLEGGDFQDYAAVQSLIKGLEEKGRGLYGGRSDAAYYVNNYGTHAENLLQQVLDGVYPSLADAEVQHVIDHEMVIEPLDFLERRSGRMNFDIASIDSYSGLVFDRLLASGHCLASDRQVAMEKIARRVRASSGQEIWR